MKATKGIHPGCWLIFLYALCWRPAIAEPEVDFIVDQNLRQCVLKTLQRERLSGPQDLEKLKCHNQKIARLDGLEKLGNLRSLSLHKNNIAQAQLNGFTHLRVLNLARNRLRSFSLDNLPKLEALYLFGNQLRELQLANLPALKQIKANANTIVDFSYRTLPLLEKVYMFDNKMEHIDIHNLPNLRYMDVRQNPMPDELYEDMDSLEGVTILHDGNADDWH